MKINSFDDVADLNTSFSQIIRDKLIQAIAERGHAYLVVSGGKTPQALFKKLADIDLPWDHVTCTLTDERWIAASMSDSNERLVKESLLQNKAAKTQFISLYNDQACFDKALAMTNAQITLLPRFDVVILGMGEDGHTASLFPDSDEIESALIDSVNAVTFVKPRAAPYQRISLTKSRLLNTRSIFIHLVGAKKMAVLQEAMQGDDELVMPIRAFLHHSGLDIQVMWAE